MSTYRGEKLQMTVWGQSHSQKIGVDVSGFPSGVEIDVEKLQQFMARRQAKKTAYSTSRIEGDVPVFSEGVENGKTVGGKLSAYIENENIRSKDYGNLANIPRPSHADYPARVKFGEDFDFRGGGQFSGRLTAPICIIGGIAKEHLEKQGIKINAYISSIGEVEGTSYRKNDITNDMIDYSLGNFPALCEKDTNAFMEEIVKTKNEGNSVGGVVECVVSNLKPGMGDVMFHSIESKIASIMYGVPAVKGLEFGSGFEISKMKGSQANDVLYYNEQGNVCLKSNHNGGITGGITNGGNITLRVAFKPTPSISIEQDSIDLKTKQNVKLQIVGRHDACIVPRTVPIVEAVVAIALLDV